MLMLFVGLVACGPSKSAGIGGTKARELIKNGALLVDVRSSLEHRFWSPIEGSVNIPYGVLPETMPKLDRARPIIVYSRTGDRSAKAQQLLAAAGFNAYNLGGLADWER